MGTNHSHRKQRSSTPAHPARQPFDHISLLLIGDAETGKTCYVETMAKCEFCATHSVCLDGTKLKLEILIAPGQEKLRVSGVHFRYYRRAEGIIVVYDATRQKTFDNIPNWVEDVRKCVHPETPVMLIGNKCDRTDKKVVDYGAAKDFADRHNFIFFEVSAKDGTNTELALMSLVTRIREKHCELYITQK